MSSSFSSPSTTGIQQPLGKIVANVVEMQHQLVTQFHSVKETIDALRYERKNDFQLFREDLRRAEDRSQKQLDELKASHSREVERLLDIIKTLLPSQRKEAHPESFSRAPTQQMGVPAASFFGGVHDAQRQMQEQMVQRMLLQQQMQQMQLMGANNFAVPNQMLSPGIPNVPPPTLTAPPPTPRLSITGQHVAQSPASVGSAPKLTPPRPSVHTVNLPVAEKPKTEPKVEEKPEKKEVQVSVPPVSKPATSTPGFGEQFKKKEGEWDCKNCYTRMDGSSDKCVCCGSNKDGTSGNDVFSKGAVDLQKAVPPATASKFSFGMAAAAAAKEVPVTAADSKPSLFGKGPASTLSSGSGSTSVFGGSAPGTPVDFKPAGSAPVFSFAKKDTSTAAPSGVTFSFKPAGTSGDKSDPPKPVFGQQNDPAKQSTGDTGTKKVFGQTIGGSSTALSFASVGNSASSIFAPGGQVGISTTKSSLSGVTTSSESGKTTTQTQENDDEGGADEEYEPDVNFAPVIPLPDLVEVTTGEEGENVIAKEWARLYRFDRENKEWKERGRGDAKILYNPTSGKFRMVMRREQVHKLCANFIITDAIEFSQHEKSRNALKWMCKDFAEDNAGSDEIFLMKFKTEEIAKNYLLELENAQGN